MITSIIRI